MRIIYEAQTLCTVPCCTREVGDSTLGLPETMWRYNTCNDNCVQGLFLVKILLQNYVYLIEEVINSLVIIWRGPGFIVRPPWKPRKLK